MMGTKERSFAPLIHVSLEDLVPTDHFYRHLERTLDLSFVREFVQETYAGGGRLSIDPIVFFKLQLVVVLKLYANSALIATKVGGSHRRRFCLRSQPIEELCRLRIYLVENPMCS